MPTVSTDIAHTTYLITRRIWVTFQKHGIHRYPGAPADVAYLQEPHRHLFKFKVSVSVFHNDRELEFHQLQNYLISLYDDAVLDLDFLSCEMMAEQLIENLSGKYPTRRLKVEVSEDGECGAVLTYQEVRL